MTEHESPTDQEANELVKIFNDAAPDYSPELNWRGMSYNQHTDTQQFVFEAGSYIDDQGISALRNHGRTIDYIETRVDDNGNSRIQIQIPVCEEADT